MILPLSRNHPFLTCRHGQARSINKAICRGCVSPRDFFAGSLRVSYKEGFPIAIEQLINQQITEKEIRVISETGEQLGIMSSRDALRLAEDKNLDLVNISPKALPPVCKIMDYGKYRYELEKKQKEAKKNQHVVTLKEVRLSPTIDTHDMAVKAKASSRFLEDGDKVKVSIRFRGRQLSHTEIGLEVMNTFLTLLENAAVEKAAKMEGRSMFMILAPKN